MIFVPICMQSDFNHPFTHTEPFKHTHYHLFVCLVRCLIVLSVLYIAHKGRLYNNLVIMILRVLSVLPAVCLCVCVHQCIILLHLPA